MFNSGRRLLIGTLAAVLCVSLLGCEKTKEPLEPVESTEGKEILQSVTQNTAQYVTATPVYASSFGDTVLLATVPVQEWRGEEADCPPREISNGGRIRCNGDHEDEVPITQVLILEDLIPRVCSGWFRDMEHLEKVQGAEHLHTHLVKDMSNMFTDCKKLTQLDWSTWDVAALENTTDMFEGCENLENLPQWYSK